jgi:hypothetical protein
MSATVRQVVDAALTIIGETAGAGVATYSEDRMMADAVRTFNMLFKKYPWPQYVQWFRLELDGTDGLVNTANAFDNVIDFEDFIGVYPDKKRKTLDILPTSLNPYSITGTQLQFWSSLPVTSADFDDYRLQFWPKTATDWVNVCAKVYPQVIGHAWAWGDTMNLDIDMLSHGVAFMTFANDDLNANSADIQRVLMEGRYKDIMNSLANQPVVVVRGNDIPTEWGVKP